MSSHGLIALFYAPPKGEFRIETMGNEGSGVDVA